MRVVRFKVCRSIREHQGADRSRDRAPLVNGSLGYLRIVEWTTRNITCQDQPPVHGVHPLRPTSGTKATAPRSSVTCFPPRFVTR